MSKSIKKILVAGASLLMMASVGAGASNATNTANASSGYHRNLKHHRTRKPRRNKAHKSRSRKHTRKPRKHIRKPRKHTRTPRKHNSASEYKLGEQMGILAKKVGSKQTPAFDTSSFAKATAEIAPDIKYHQAYIPRDYIALKHKTINPRYMVLPVMDEYSYFNKHNKLVRAPIKKDTSNYVSEARKLFNVLIVHKNVLNKSFRKGFYLQYNKHQKIEGQVITNNLNNMDPIQNAQKYLNGNKYDKNSIATAYWSYAPYKTANKDAYNYMKEVYIYGEDGEGF